MWGGGRDFGGVKHWIFWMGLIAFWAICLGAQTAQAQLSIPTALSADWPALLQTGGVIVGTVAVIVRIDTTQKAREKNDERWERMFADIKGELKDIRSEMFSRHEVEEARRTMSAEHKAFDDRITRLEQA